MSTSDAHVEDASARVAMRLARRLVGRMFARPRPIAAFRKLPIANPDELRRVMKLRGTATAAGGL